MGELNAALAQRDKLCEEVLLERQRFEKLGEELGTERQKVEGALMIQRISFGHIACIKKLEWNIVPHGKNKREISGLKGATV